MRRSGALLVAALVAALLVAAPAGAANRQISISNYRWSEPEVNIDLGEHVTWNWIGPDLVHSVTGNSSNSFQWDSDPQTSLPHHKLGDSYRLTFDQPGIYSFHCKLHSTVKGEIVVSNQPGDPVTEPDPVPVSQIDLSPPHLREVGLKKRQFSRRGTVLKFALNEPSKVEADIYRYDSKGKRQFKGWSSSKGHVGYNEVRFAARGKHFNPSPGSYVAELRATDDVNNTSKPQRLRFEITGH